MKIEKKMIENRLKMYNESIPNKVLFNLKTIEELGIAKISTMKKLILNGEISIVKIGNKIHIHRAELIRFIDSNTVDVLTHSNHKTD